MQVCANEREVFNCYGAPFDPSKAGVEYSPEAGDGRQQVPAVRYGCRLRQLCFRLRPCPCASH